MECEISFFHPGELLYDVIFHEWPSTLRLRLSKNAFRKIIDIIFIDQNFDMIKLLINWEIETSYLHYKCVSELDTSDYVHAGSLFRNYNGELYYYLFKEFPDVIDMDNLYYVGKGSVNYVYYRSMFKKKILEQSLLRFVKFFVDSNDSDIIIELAKENGYNEIKNSYCRDQILKLEKQKEEIEIKIKNYIELLSRN